VSIKERLYTPEVVVAGTGHAIERARSRGAEWVEPDDLLTGMLLSVSRFGVLDLGSVSIDLQALGLAFDMEQAVLTVSPAYSPDAAAVFTHAARIARGDGGGPILPIHLLVALADPAIPIFGRLCERFDLDAPAWRRLLAAIDPPGPSGLQHMASDDAWLSTDEAARMLGLHIQTLRGYIRDGKLAAFRIAGQRSLRIRRQDLSDLLKHLDHQPPKQLTALPDV
jgi:excisionase family DNA binding protein